LPNICKALTAHLPSADDNSLIGCTSHDSTDDWSQPVPISLTAGAHFAARLGAFFYRTRLFGPQCTVRQYHSDLSDQSAQEIRVRIRVRLKRCTILAFFTANEEKEHLFFGEFHWR